MRRMNAMISPDERHDEESFVRHCYFTGASVSSTCGSNRRLQADIDDDFWAAFYRLSSGSVPDFVEGTRSF
jgi:hypothetical protein